MHSKNDVFTTNWSVRPPPPIKRLSESRREQHAASKSAENNGKIASAGLTAASSVPTVVEPSATASVKPSEGLEVRLLSHHELGHGRHATVHLALYREHNEGRFSRSYQEHTSANPTWTICAAKRFAAGKAAQVAGLSEALMLSRLSKCNQVLKYIGIKDERPFTRPSSSRGNSSTDISDVDGSAQAAQGDASPSSRPSIARSHSNTSISTPSSPIIKPQANDTSIPTLIGLQQRQQEENKSSLRRNATMKAPKSPSRLSGGRQTLSINTTNAVDDAPRMLLLTEYCPLGNLATFVLHHGQDVLGQKMFFQFAIDLMSALVAVHDKNIIHGDVKPQNCMIDTSFNLKLGDFSSSLFNSPDLDDGIGLGTTQYSSPEVVRMPPSPFSFPIDIFSAGLTLLYMITGVQPYESLTMASCNRSDRFTPKSPRSPRGTPGNVTPTSVSSKRKIRSSSGAGKMVELHVHLSKGHAWEWEERRRFQELEDNFIEDHSEQISRPSSPLTTQDLVISLPEISTLSDSPEHQDKAFDSVPQQVLVPESLLDLPAVTTPRNSLLTYSDGYTPIQTFLRGGAVVPEMLRDLIRRMLEPNAANRPNSTQALQELESLQDTTRLYSLQRQ